MFITAQILSLFALITNVIAMQLKTKHQILIISCVANLFFTFSYFLLDAYVGAFISFGYIVITVIDLFLEKNNSDTPNQFIVVYLITLIVVSMIEFNNIIDIFPVLASAVALNILKVNNEQRIRIIRLVNSFLWLTYDIFVHAYGALASDLFIIISVVIALHRYKNLKSLIR